MQRDALSSGELALQVGAAVAGDGASDGGNRQEKICADRRRIPANTYDQAT